MRIAGSKECRDEKSSEKGSVGITSSKGWRSWTSDHYSEASGGPHELRRIDRLVRKRASEQHDFQVVVLQREAEEEEEELEEEGEDSWRRSADGREGNERDDKQGRRGWRAEK